jgi:hypothetical protein
MGGKRQPSDVEEMLRALQRVEYDASTRLAHDKRLNVGILERNQRYFGATRPAQALANSSLRRLFLRVKLEAYQTCLRMTTADIESEVARMQRKLDDLSRTAAESNGEPHVRP